MDILGAKRKITIYQVNNGYVLSYDDIEDIEPTPVLEVYEERPADCNDRGFSAMALRDLLIMINYVLSYDVSSDFDKEVVRVIIEEGDERE